MSKSKQVSSDWVIIAIAASPILFILTTMFFQWITSSQ